MLSKLICAAALAHGTAAVHSVHTRDAPYNSINRDGGGHGHGHGGGGGGHGGGGGGSSYGAPSSSYNAPAPSYSAPSPSYDAPAPSYNAPSYEAPAPSYGAPSYDAPAPSYNEPSSSYGEPSSSYGSPSTGYGDEGGLDLTSILIPLLALVGLSLLFPTYVSLTTVRKKREAGDEQSGSALGDVVDRVNDIYLSVLESEECMERIACEIGGLANDVGLKDNAVAKMADPFVPAKYKAYYKQFRTGQDCHKIKCGNLF